MIMEEVNHQALTSSYVTATEQPPCCFKQVVKTCEPTVVLIQRAYIRNVESDSDSFRFW